MIIVVPTAAPATTPLESPMVAAAVLLLNHVPPGTVLVRVDVAPMHTVPGPPIAGGIGLTVITAVM